MCFSLEAQEIEKQNVISASAQVKRDHTLPLELDQWVVNLRWQEEEDDRLFKLDNKYKYH
jgi:hypothetical protein